jgi:hypothetical protein
VHSAAAVELQGTGVLTPAAAPAAAAAVAEKYVSAPRNSSNSSKSVRVWQPASSKWHWLVGCLLVWIATASSMAGYIAANQIAGKVDISEHKLMLLEVLHYYIHHASILGSSPHSTMLICLHWLVSQHHNAAATHTTLTTYTTCTPTLPLLHYYHCYYCQATYNSTVLSNYAAATGVQPAADFWPPQQVLFTDADLFNCFLGREDSYHMMCEVTSTGAKTNPIYQYGHPLPCANMGRCYTWAPILQCILSWTASLVVTYVASLLLTRMQRRSVGDGIVSSTSCTSSSSGIACGGPAMLKAFGSAAGMQLHSGRPSFSKFLGSASSSDAVLDVYVCGSEDMQAAVYEAFDAAVRPVMRAASIHSLKFSIGG